MPQPIGWLTKAEMDDMLKVPDRKTPRGRSEYALLLFLYNTGARVSEATQMRVDDLQVDRRDGGHALATLHGKGGKIRQCPLWPATERVLAELIDGRAADDVVFRSRLQKPFTRFGVYWLVERCAARVPTLSGRKITPPCAQAYNSLPLGSCWRGHRRCVGRRLTGRPSASRSRPAATTFPGIRTGWSSAKTASPPRLRKVARLPNPGHPLIRLTRRCAGALGFGRTRTDTVRRPPCSWR